MTTTLPPIANLCQRCRVVEFDDSAWPAAYEAGSDTEGYYLSISDESPNPYRLKLDYFLLDSVPEFPWLSDTADRGCDFCAMLKETIGRYAQDCFDEVMVSLFYQWHPFDNPMQDGSDSIGLKSLIAQLVFIGYDKKGDHLSSATWLHFGIDSPSGPCAQWLRLEQSPWDDALCTDNIQMVYNNLEDSSHIRSSTEGTVYPTRLIDVGGKGSTSCRLVETNSDITFMRSPQIQYAALSYCWGPKEDIALQFQTEQRSLQSRLDGFELHQVSPILRDAIQVTQALGMRYIWVDAVCIIQDNKEDWDKESSLMSLVYQNATLAICTPNSISCQQGFLARNWVMTRLRFRSRINEDVSGTYVVRFVGDVSNPFHAGVDCLTFSLQHSQWGLRGWVLQEYELSQRALIFGRTRLHIVTENGVQSETSKMIERSESTRGARYIHNAQDDRAKYMGWIMLVEDYSHRKLTDHSDKLPAISGLASRSFGAYSKRFLAGHIFPHIDLFWTTVFSQPNLKWTKETLLDHLQSQDTYTAPSWSWASRNHPIEFGERRFRVLSSPDFSPIREECDIIEASVSLAGSNPFGRVKGGSLVINTVVVPLHLQVRLFARMGWYDKPWRADENGQYVADLRLDWDETKNTESFEEMSLVLIGSRKVEDNLSWDPVQVIYEHEVKDYGFSVDISDPSMDMWIITGVTGTTSSGTDEQNRIIYTKTNIESGFEDNGRETTDIQQVSAQSKENATGSAVDKERENTEVEAQKATAPLSDISTSGSLLSEDEDRYAYGIIIHPASVPGKYLRVGVFYSVPRERGGLQYFRNRPKQTVEII